MDVPTRQASQFNWNAPTLDDATVHAFRSDDRLRAALLDSLRQMLDFYGFQLREENGAPIIETATNWDARQREWFHAGGPQPPAHHAHPRLPEHARPGNARPRLSLCAGLRLRRRARHDPAAHAGILAGGGFRQT